MERQGGLGRDLPLAMSFQAPGKATEGTHVIVAQDGVSGPGKSLTLGYVSLLGRSR